MTNIYSEKKKSIIYRAAEVGLLFVIGIYILTIDISKTTLKLDFDTHRIEDLIIVALSVLAIIRLGSLLAEFKDERKRLLKFILCALAVDAVYFCVWHENPGRSLMVLMLLTLSTVALDYVKILRVYIIAASAVIFTAIAMEWIGAIENYVYIRDMTIRSSWGIKYPTDMMSLLFFLLLTVWVVYGRKGGFWYVIPGGIIMIMSYFVADSRTGVLCGLLFAVTVIAWNLSSRGKEGRYPKAVELCLCGAFPFFTVVMNGLVFAYRHGSGWANRINIILSNRLDYSVQALNEYGLSLWGRPLEQVGWGGTVFARPGYNFVDISYVLLLLKYGVVVLVVVNILWVLMTRHALRTGDKRLALAFTLIAVNCAIEHHIVQINYDIFAAIPFAVLLSEGHEGNECAGAADGTDGRVSLKTALIKLAAAAVLAAAVSVCVLALLPEARTVITLINMDNSAGGRRILALAVAAGLFAAAKCIGCAYDLILGLAFRDGRNIKKDAAAAAALVLALCLTVGASNYLIKRGAAEKDDLVESERSVIELVQANKTGGLYVKGMPDIYRKKYGGISSSLFNGEELARYGNTSVIMEINLDSPCFFDTGFLYLPISEKHSLFTNDEAVIKALQKEGYHLTGYFPAERTVNLESLAKENGADLTSDGAIVLHGEKETLSKGPGKDLREGRYTITYDLSVDVPPAGGDDEVCRLVTTFYKGEYELSNITLTGSDFDENGESLTEVIIEMPDAENTDFGIYPVGNNTLSVKDIRYRKTPVCDVHSKYNEDKIKFREEYYDLEGNPSEQFTGYFARDLGYDGDDNVDHEIYYDTDYERTLNTDGYSEIRRTFDGSHNVLRDEYYGLDGERTVLSAGQFAADYIYDESGRQKEIRYFDADDKPVLIGGAGWGGYQSLSRDFDEEGRIVRVAFFGTDGEPVRLREGYSSRRYEYDERGNRVTEAYFDTGDRPAACSDGYSMIKRVFDESDRVIREEFYGTDGNRVTLPAGQSAVEYTYDSEGQQKELCYLDINNEPVEIGDETHGGYCRVSREFDDSGRIVYERYLDRDGNPVTLKEGFAARSYEYDAKGVRTGETKYDISGNEI